MEKKINERNFLEGNGFVDQGLIEFNDPDRDFHIMYVDEIMEVLDNE